MLWTISSRFEAPSSAPFRDVLLNMYPLGRARYLQIELTSVQVCQRTDVSSVRVARLPQAGIGGWPTVRAGETTWCRCGSRHPGRLRSWCDGSRVGWAVRRQPYRDHESAALPRSSCTEALRAESCRRGPGRAAVCRGLVAARNRGGPRLQPGCRTPGVAAQRGCHAQWLRRAMMRTCGWPSVR
jgi:hypothetical protein